MNNNLNILYVEDDIWSAKQIVGILRRFFKKVDIAASGFEGYELFKNNQYDIIITDINMPIMNGLDMIEKIRDMDKDISIIITSAYNETQYLTKSIDLSVDGYVLKPIDIEQLVAVVNKSAKIIEEHKLNIKNIKLISEYKNAIDDSTIVSKTNPKGIITYANEEFIKLSGYTKEELIGSNHNIIRHPDTPKGIFSDMWETILNKQVWKGRVKNRKKNGEYYWVSVTISPIVDDNDEIIEFIAIRNDITLEMEYRKNLEKKVKEKVEQLRQKDKVLHHQSKLAAMGEMVDAIAHQWKQPINLIKMKTELVGYDYNDGLLNSDTIKNFQNDVNDQIDHILYTLDEFRNFLRPNKATKEFNAQSMLNSVLVLIQDELVKHTIGTQIIQNHSLVINGIENEFKHVILNLINNAKDAFIENGIPNRKIVIIIDSDSIQVQDNAGGIPLDVIDRVFDANVTTKEDGKGTGIGLYMTKQIVEKINGTISVENKNGGACFTITLK